MRGPHRQERGSPVAKKNALSVAEWVSSRPGKRPKCPACLDAKARDSVAEILEAMAKLGRHEVSQNDILTRLRETLGVSFGLSSLRRHIAEHEAERWSRAKGR